MSAAMSFARLCFPVAALVTAGLLACSVTPPTAPDAEPRPTTMPGGSGGTGDSGGSGGNGGGGVEGGVALGGRFAGLAGHSASGGVTFRVSDGTAELIFGEDFSSTPVPDPHVYVSTEPDANRGSRLRIATLASSRGAQRYAFRLPEGVQHGFVLVWCDKYNVGVGAARLGNLP